MKKRVFLLLTLMVSLFIYSSRVNAIVMWMQCTNDAEGKMYYNEKVGNNATQFARYNTFAVINSYNTTGNSIRHVLYYGGTDANGRSKNFFEDEGPTYISNPDGDDPAYEVKACWFKNEGNGKEIGKNHRDDKLTECDEPDETVTPMIDASMLNQGICPNSVYQTTSSLFDWGTGGSIMGDYVVMTGTLTPNKSNTEEINDYKFAMYEATVKADDGIEYPIWIMETYDKNGIYGSFFSLTPENACKMAYPDSSYENVRDTCVKMIDKGDLTSFYRVLGLGFGKSGDKIISPHDDEEDFSDYLVDYSYTDNNQATQLVRLYYLGRNYFKLTEYQKYPEVFIANIGGLKDKNIKRYNSDSVLSYEKGMDVWDKVKEWENLVKGSLEEQDSIFSKFSSNGEYNELLKTAENVSESISLGKKYDLNVDSSGNLIDIDSTINKLNSSYDDINVLLEKTDLYPLYELAPGAEGRIVTGNFCKTEPSRYTNDPSSSLMSYVSCQTIGVPFTYALKNYFGVNVNVVSDIYKTVMIDQINTLGVESDIFNFNDKIEEYAFNLSKYTAYIQKNYSDKLTDMQKNKLDEILNKYLNLCRTKFHKEIIVDCDTLLGKDFMDKIEKYVDIIKISIPLLLIGYGIYDFASAIFSGDDEKMKKAQKRFIMRIIISILFFLLPFIIKIILSIANKAWSFISPSGCSFL